MDELSKILENALEAQGETAAYENYCRRDRWSVFEFIALVAGLTPKNYLARKNSSPEISAEVYQKRRTGADQLLKRFIGKRLI